MCAEIVIMPTSDVAAVMKLGTSAGLEKMERDLDGLLAMWGAYDGERLVGAIMLRHFFDLDVVGWLAVDEPYRGHRLGSRLLGTLEQEARGRGVTRLWATARAPGFFFRHGYAEAEAGPASDSLLASCPQCAQFGITCTPQAVSKSLAVAGERTEPK